MFYKIILAFFIISVIAAGCKSSKQVQKRSSSKTRTNNSTTGVWQAKLDNLLAFPSDISSFYAKVKADFDSPGSGGNATVYIRMLKDSLIWVSVTGPFNIEGARILITRDSVKVLDKLHQRAEVGSIAAAGKFIPLPISFVSLQNFVLGKPVFPSGNPTDFSAGENALIIKTADNLINYTLLVDSSSFQPDNNTLEEKKLTDKKGCVINNSNFTQSGSVLFPQTRKIEVTGSKPATLELSFKEYNFNREQTYPFTIPKSYTVRYY